MSSGTAALIAAQIAPVLFAVFAMASAGCAGMYAVLLLRDRLAGVRLPLAWASIATGALALVATVLRFQKIDRFFNAFSHLGSPLSQALIALVVGIVLVVAMVALARNGEVAKALPVIAIAVALFACVTQGRLLCSSSKLAAEPWLGALLFVGAGVAIGCAAALLTAAVRGEADELPRALGCSCLGGVVAMVVGVAGISVLRASVEAGAFGSYTNPLTFGSQTATVDFWGLVAGGDLTVLFWVGTVVPLVVALVAAVLGCKPAKNRALVGGVLVVLGVLVSSTAFQLVYLAAVNLTKVRVFG